MKYLVAVTIDDTYRISGAARFIEAENAEEAQNKFIKEVKAQNPRGDIMSVGIIDLAQAVSEMVSW